MCKIEIGISFILVIVVTTEISSIWSVAQEVQLPYTCLVLSTNWQRKPDILLQFQFIIPLCKHVVAKVTLVPCSINLTGKQDTVGHGEVTINNARIIHT